MTRPIDDTPRRSRIRIVHDKQLELMQIEMRVAAGLGLGGPTVEPAGDTAEQAKQELRRPGPKGAAVPRRRVRKLPELSRLRRKLVVARS